MYDLAWKYNKESHRLAEAVTKDYEAMIVAYIAFYNTISDVPHEIQKASDAIKAKDPEGWKTGAKVLTELQNNSNFRDVALITTTGGMLTTLKDAEAAVMKQYTYVFEIKKWYDKKASGKDAVKATDLDVFKAAQTHIKNCQNIIDSILKIKSDDRDVTAFVKATGTLWSNIKKGSAQEKAANDLVALIKREIGRAKKKKKNELPMGYLDTLAALLPDCMKIPKLISDVYKADAGLKADAKGAQGAYDQMGAAVATGMKKMSTLLGVVRKPRWNIQGLAREFDDLKKTSAAEMLKHMKALERDWVTDKKNFETLRSRFASAGSFNIALEAKFHDHPKRSPLKNAIFEYNENFVMGSPSVNNWTGTEMRAHEK
ncbi:hypothetical protein CKA38_12980 [Ereboglobus luteus]|uniref:Uncharacterized protein n=2 Tax=Ereboglobus luteus TaxID=1796921 RepID=A0A2U8E5E2_9BACT|nr:hypothetical protein CKA38_12980 [Ereboglobus luteus]